MALEVDPVGGALGDLVPELLKPGGCIQFLVQFAGHTLTLALDDGFHLAGVDDVDDIVLVLRIGIGQLDSEAKLLGHPAALNLALVVYVTVLVEVIPDLGRMFRAQNGFFPINHDRQAREFLLTHKADRHACLLILVLECGSKRLIRLVSHHRQLRQPRIANTFTGLIHWQTQATTNRLAALGFRGHVTQHADLEHVRVIPALTQRGVGKNEPHRLIHAEQTGLVTHDQLIRVIIRLGLARRVLKRHHRALALTRLLHLSEIATARFQRRSRHDGLGLGLASQFLGVKLIEPGGKVAVRVQVVYPVSEIGSDLIDKEQGQHFDALGVDREFLTDVLADGLADHLPEHRVLVRANLIPNMQVPVVGQFDAFRLNADLAHPPVALISRVTARKPLQIITQRGGHLALGIRAVLLTAHQLQGSLERVTRHPRKQLHIRLSRATKLLSVRDHDRLNQAELMGVQRVQPVHQVTDLPVGCGVA